MVGGDAAVYPQIEPVLTAIAARYKDVPCCAHVGPDGAGHFVKTMHNGIEYADMQMIAEIYELMRAVGGATPAEIGATFEQWNSGALDSYLIEITAEVLKAVDPDSGQPMVDVILDRAGQKGTGGWASIESISMGVPATTLIEAVGARAVSALLTERLQAAPLYPLTFADAAPSLDSLKPTLEKALLAGKVCAYAQGFAVLQAASDEYQWQLPMAQIARIWRAGCIIRSSFLDDIASAFAANDLPNLLQASHFVDIMSQSHQALRDVLAIGVQAGVPMPALGSALAYFDGYRRERTSASLNQAQRDFFGAHGFERRDRSGRDFHGPWGMSHEG
jgi:6-phosphogluconate dehydrogenase